MNKIDLYISNNQGFKLIECEISQLSFNYSIFDLINPTKIQNSFTKSIEIPKTKSNNDFFGSIFSIDSTFTNFNPNSKANFILNLNDSLFEKGYCKLTQITENHYVINLFGEIGNLFYNLNLINENKDDGRLKNLPATFDQQIVLNSNNIANNLQGNLSYTSTYLDYSSNSQISEATLQFMLANNGYYTNFASGKMANINNISDVTFIDASLNEISAGGNVTENERSGNYSGGSYYFGEYRAYEQRPCLRLKYLLNLIFDKISKMGYKINLDPVFFGSNNPYWQETWLTMPKLKTEDNQNINNGNNITVSGLGTNAVLANAVSQNYNGQNVNSSFYLPLSSNANSAIRQGNNTIFVEVPFNIRAWQPSLTWWANPQWMRGEATIQVYLLINGTKYYLNYVNQSGQTLKLNRNTVAKVNPSNFNGDSSIYQRGDYDYTIKTSSAETWGSDNQTGTMYLFRGLFNINSNINTNVSLVFDIQGDTWWDRVSSGQSPRNYSLQVRVDYTNFKMQVSNNPNTGIGNNSIIIFSDILKSNETCYDLLTSYTKLFGLYVFFDPITNNFNILTKNSYYQNQIIDLSQKYDTQNIETKHINKDYKYGVIRYKDSGTKYEKLYKNRTAFDFGSIRFDTGYQFSDEEKILFETIFQNCIIAQDFSFFNNGRNSILNKDNKEIAQFSDESKNIVRSSFSLLFIDGYASVNFPYLVSDDSLIMDIYGKSWLNIGSGTFNAQFYRLCNKYPKFTKIVNRNGIIYSINIGRPSIVYNDTELALTASTSSVGDETIYSIFHRNFIHEIYNENTKLINIDLDLNNQNIRELTRKFISIKNRIFSIQKINSYDLSRKSVNCDLISVNDLNNYTNSQSFFFGDLWIRQSDSGGSYVFDSTGVNASNNTLIIVNIPASGYTRTYTSPLPIISYIDSNGIITGQSQTPPDEVPAYTFTVTIPAATSSNINLTYSISVNYGGIILTFNFIQQQVYLVQTITDPLTTGTINGLSSPQYIAGGGTAIFDMQTASIRTFICWIINNNLTTYTTPYTYTINQDTIAQCFTYLNAQQSLLTIYDQYSSILDIFIYNDGNVKKAVINLNDWNTIRFINQDGFSGYLFSNASFKSDLTYSFIGSNNLTLTVYYNTLLFNILVLNNTTNNISNRIIKLISSDGTIIDQTILVFSVNANSMASFAYSIPNNVTNFNYYLQYNNATFNINLIDKNTVYDIVMTINNVQLGWVNTIVTNSNLTFSNTLYFNSDDQLLDITFRYNENNQISASQTTSVLSPITINFNTLINVNETVSVRTFMKSGLSYSFNLILVANEYWNEEEVSNEDLMNPIINNTLIFADSNQATISIEIDPNTPNSAIYTIPDVSDILLTKNNNNLTLDFKYNINIYPLNYLIYANTDIGKSLMFTAVIDPISPGWIDDGTGNSTITVASAVSTTVMYTNLNDSINQIVSINLSNYVNILDQYTDRAINYLIISATRNSTITLYINNISYVLTINVK